MTEHEGIKVGDVVAWKVAAGEWRIGILVELDRDADGAVLTKVLNAAKAFYPDFLELTKVNFDE